MYSITIFKPYNEKAVEPITIYIYPVDDEDVIIILFCWFISLLDAKGIGINPLVSPLSVLHIATASNLVIYSGVYISPLIVYVPSAEMSGVFPVALIS